MGDKVDTSSLVCQVCLQPIILDKPIERLDDAGASNRNAMCSVPKFKLDECNSCIDEFMLVSDAEQVDFLSPQLKLQVELCNILSDKTNIDHALCEECTDTLFELLEDQLKLIKTECEEYEGFLSKISSTESSSIATDSLLEELANAEAEEKELMNELEKLKEEENKIDEDIRKEIEVSEKLVLEEQRYWKAYSKSRREVMLLDDELKNLEYKTDFAQNQLVSLEKVNVFNASFHIWHRGHFGTINNFRLGRLPNEPVEWSEINAACGQIALLLHSIARRVNFTFQRYKIVPYGNHSYIEVLSDKKRLPLYFLGGIRYLWNTRFDSGMVAFLDCVQQFKEYVEKFNFNLPYQIDKDRIFDRKSCYSIKVVLNTEDQWTKAMKFLLINLKWSLAWISSEIAVEDDKLRPTSLTQLPSTSTSK